MKVTMIIIAAWFIIANLFSKGHVTHGSVIEKAKFIFDFKGKCAQGKVYTIKKQEDLEAEALRPELECVYNAGLVPSKVITGDLFGRFVSVLNRGAPVADMLGKQIQEVKCAGGQGEPKTLYLGSNIVTDPPYRYAVVPFLARIDQMRDQKMEPGEYLDHRDSLLLDYTRNFATEGLGCQELLTVLSEGTLVTPVNPYPLSAKIDSIRLVGKQENKGNIYLGKTYVRNPATSKFRTMVFFSVVNYDEVNPEFAVGDSLPALPADFEFTIEGV